MKFEEEFSYYGVRGDIIRVAVVRHGVPKLTLEQRVASKEAFRELRLKVEWNYVVAVLMAQWSRRIRGKR